MFPFRSVSKAIREPSREKAGSKSALRENVTCRWPLPSGRITKTSASPERLALYAICEPSRENDAPIVRSDACVCAIRMTPLPSGFTSISEPLWSLKTMRPFTPGNAARLDCDAVAAAAPTRASKSEAPTARSISPKRMPPPSIGVELSLRRDV